MRKENLFFVWKEFYNAQCSFFFAKTALGYKAEVYFFLVYFFPVFFFPETVLCYQTV